MKTRTILISGGGVAGRALAFWLVRHGHRPTIVERAPGPRHGGYKVDIRGAAVEVVQRMGLLDEVRRASTDMRTASFVDDDGKLLATMDAELFGGRGGDDVEIVRGDLTRILEAATDSRHRDDLRQLDHRHLRDRRRCRGHVCNRRAAHLRPRCRSRRPPLGRACGWCSDRSPSTLHHLGYDIAIFSVPNRLGLNRGEVTLATPDGRRSSTAPVRAATRRRCSCSHPDRPRHDRSDPTQQRQIVADAFAGRGWAVPRLLEEMWAAPDFYFDSVSQIHMDRWSTARVALVGDAAYASSPASGQGTSVALVGAYVLAGELAATSEDVGSAFLRYEAAMRSFVDLNQQLAGRNIKGMVLGSPAQLRFQMLMLRLLPHLPGRERIASRISDGIRSAATSIDLDEYGTGTLGMPSDTSRCRAIADPGVDLIPGHALTGVRPHRAGTPRWRPRTPGARPRAARRRSWLSSFSRSGQRSD